MKRIALHRTLVVGLIVLLASVLQLAHAQDGVGIDVANPLEMLDVDGAIKIGTDFNNSTAAPQGGAGTIRWNGTNFQGWDGTQWVNFQGTGNLGWELTGNAGTTAGTNFIGTTDDQDVVFKRNNTEAGRLNNALRNTGFGVTGGIGSGQYNSGFGWHVFSNGTSGDGNAALGWNIMTGASGSYNTAMGWQAMTYTSSGSRNVALGLQAMRGNTTGSDNVAIGHNAGISNATGNRNVFIGRVAGENATGSSNIFIGNGAGRNETGDNRLYIDNSNTTSPLLYGEFDTDILGVNGSLGVGTQSPSTALHVVPSSSSGPTATFETGSNQYPGAAVKVTPSTHATSERASLQIDDWHILQDRVGNGTKDFAIWQQSTASQRFNIDVNGNVGIGDQTPDEKLDIEGSIQMVDGNQAAGFIPVSDANGTMTWTDPTTIATASVNEIVDADNDTKIQVEESNDEDIIRFDMAGTEYFRMSNGKIHVGNTNESVYMGNGAGAAADYAETSEKNNVGIGTLALNDISTGGWNTALGYGSLEKVTTGVNNIGVGPYAMGDNTTGSHNTAVGAGAGDNHATGDENVFLGRSSGTGGAGSGNVLLGAYSGQNQTLNDRLFIENSNSSTPLIYGEFDNDIIGLNGNVAVGHQSPNANLDVTGSNSGATSLALRGGDNWNSFDSNQMTFAYNGTQDYRHAIKTRHYANGKERNAFDFYVWDRGVDAVGDVGTKRVMTIDGRDQGMVGIGTGDPLDELHVEGSIRMVDGNEASGFIPVSDANGTMTWTDPTTIATASVDEIVDADNDTKIQVEESADEDIIRFDVEGTEVFKMRQLGGYSYLQLNSDAVFIGNGLSSTVTGPYNTVVGFQAGSALTTGETNVLVGANAGSSLTDGRRNVIMGNTAGQSIAGGHGNTILGGQAGRNKTGGDYNVIIGYDAGTNSTAGSNNVFLGRQAGESNAGSNNVFLGKQAGQNETASNRLYIDNSGTASPLIYGEFDNDVVGVNGSLGVGTQSPSTALHVVPSSSSGPTATFETGSNQYPGAAVKITPSTHATSERASVQIDDWHILQDRIGNGTKDFAIWQQSTTSQRFNIDVNGNVGIGDQTPDEKLDVEGSIQMVDGNQAAGFIPVSDANGTMTWTDPTSIATAAVDEVVDADNDTKIQVEETADEDKIRFDTGGSERMVIDENGNLGVGTDTPQTLLHIQNNASGLNFPLFLRNTSVTTGDGVGMGFLTEPNGNWTKAGIYHERTAGFGVGKLHFLVDDGADNQSVTTAETRMTITPQGNIGIGEVNPLDELHVVGSVRMVDGNQTAGYIPVSDANGTMTWTDPTTVATADDGDWTISGSNIYSAVSGNVGIGTATPQTKAHVSASDGQTLMLTRDDSNITSGEQLGGIGFDGADGNIPDDIRESSAAIIAFATETHGTGDKGGRLSFWTSPTNQNDDTDGFERLRIDQNGTHYVGADMYWRDNDVSGTNIARIIDDGDDGQMILYENGSSQILLDANGTSVFNEQGLDRDFRVESDGQTHMFFIDAGNNRIGIRSSAPEGDLFVSQSSATSGGTGGVYVDWNGDHWKTFHSGLHYSFANEGTRYAYVEDNTGNYVQPSDENLKTNINEVADVLAGVKELNPVTYTYKSSSDPNSLTYGFLAQEVAEVFPDVVRYTEDGTPALAYDMFGILSIKAIQEQQALIESLKAENAELKAENSATAKRLQLIEEQLGIGPKTQK